jgi:hypothetical protein
MVDNAKPVRESLSFVEVVRDEHSRHGNRSPQFAEFGMQLTPGAPIHRGERFVQQKHIGLARSRASDGEALLLAAREGRRPPIVKSVEMDKAEQCKGPLASLRRVPLRHGGGDVA